MCLGLGALGFKAMGLRGLRLWGSAMLSTQGLGFGVEVWVFGA